MLMPTALSLGLLQRQRLARAELELLPLAGAPRSAGTFVPVQRSGGSGSARDLVTAGQTRARPELPSRFSLAGPTDLSMKGGASSTAPSNSTSRGMQAAQLSPTEISAVRQLIAGYRESAAFLLRSADELENLILQQN